MKARPFVTGILVGCLLSALIAAALPPGPGGGQPQARLALQQLQSEFHEASVLGDHDMMFSLWADDAVFSNPAVTLNGPAEIAEWFAANPLWGEQVALSPSYKTQFDIQGSRAEFVFECVVVDVSGQDPLTVSLADGSGEQDDTVEIVLHSSASGSAVKRGDRWVFQTFTGTLVPDLD